MTGFTVKVAEHVLKAAQRGEISALNQIYLCYGSKILRRVSGILGSQEDGRDLTQEIFLRVFAKLPELKDLDAFPGWLKQISISMSIDQLRYRAKFDSEEWVDMADNSQHWHQAYDCLTQLDDIEKIMCHLSVEDRALVWLYVVEGYNHAELATLFLCTESAMRQRYRRAMLKLKDILTR